MEAQTIVNRMLFFFLPQYVEVYTVFMFLSIRPHLVSGVDSKSELKMCKVHFKHKMIYLSFKSKHPYTLETQTKMLNTLKCKDK